MTQIYTQNDLIRYIFKETTEEENSDIERELLAKDEGVDFYVDACDIVRQVKALNLEPSDNTVRAILDYSRSVGVNP